MGAHKLFCSKENLEEILYFEEEHQTIYNIVNEFCDVVLDVDEEEVLVEIGDNPMLKSLFKRDSYGIVGDKKMYESFHKKEYKYFLNDLIIESDKDIIDELRNGYGVLALKLGDDFLEKQNIHFGYSIGSDKNSLKCWSELFNKNKVSPVNSAILIDNFLWSDLSNYKQENEDNIYPILENLIPNSLKVPFHLTIVVQNGKAPLLKKEKAKEIINKMTKRVVRKNGLSITIVTQTDTATFHERMILTNYHYITSDKGFAAFRNGRVKNKTKGFRDWVFKDINNYIGEINKHEHQRSALNVSNLVRENSRGDDNDVIFCQGDMDSPIFSNFS